jgi:2'-5' RNA ligase
VPVKRIFVAVDISDEAREKAGEYAARLAERTPASGIKFVRPEKLHLTLRFFGRCDDDQLKRVTDAVRIAAETITPFRATVSGTGLFPDERNPRVLWLGVGGELDQMLKAKTLIETEFAKPGSMPKAERFVPHLTIARIKDSRLSRDIVDRHLASQFGPVEFEVNEIVIYESRLLPAGSEYSPVVRFKLG